MLSPLLKIALQMIRWKIGGSHTVWTVLFCVNVLVLLTKWPNALQPDGIDSLQLCSYIRCKFFIPLPITCENDWVWLTIWHTHWDVYFVKTGCCSELFCNINSCTLPLLFDQSVSLCSKPYVFSKLVLTHLSRPLIVVQKMINLQRI